MMCSTDYGRGDVSYEYIDSPDLFNLRLKLRIEITVTDTRHHQIFLLTDKWLIFIMMG